MAQDKHCFALFSNVLQAMPSLAVGHDATIVDKELWFRIATVLRLRVGDELIVFDDIQVVTGNLVFCGSVKDVRITLEVTNIQPIEQYKQQPRITLVQGLTKKSTFEDIVYSAAQCGVTTIIPMLSDKIHKAWDVDHEHERLINIMRSACEQAKSFVVPTITPAITLEKFLATTGVSTPVIVLDPNGENFTSLLGRHAYIQHYTIILGPEGGFSSTETVLLQQQGCVAYRLGSAILRSQDAALVALGMLRSF